MIVGAITNLSSPFKPYQRDAGLLAILRGAAREAAREAQRAARAAADASAQTKQPLLGLEELMLMFATLRMTDPTMSDATFFAPLGVVNGKDEIDETARRKLWAEWRDRVTDSQLGHDSVELTRTVRPVLASLARFGDAAVDLTGFRPEQVNPMHLAVVLRVTSTRKTSTRGWDDALQVARSAMERKGIPADKALLGLV
jgi:hypothetical protein